MSNTATTLLSGIKEVDDPRHMDTHEAIRIATEDKNAYRHWADVNIVTPSTANSEFTVSVSGFNRTPIGYEVIKQDKAVNVYNGSTTWAKDTLYLKASVATASITVRVIG